METNQEGEKIWKYEDLTEVLEWIYKYSNKKYGKYKDSCKLDQNITVDRIRVHILTIYV